MAAVPVVFAIAVRIRGVRRPNIKRVGCVTDEDDFTSVRLTTPAPDSSAGDGVGSPISPLCHSWWLLSSDWKSRRNRQVDGLSVLA